ncbi:hypothetical protein [Methanobrevibacter sp.]|uniref:arsenate reductase/protein-tyrosine-phosphatase family protein n=1 Tax=Methanobrevibacter sp. TaxID=66852 RepID=UPI00388FCEFF
MRIMFVCTANTSRSAMAEAIFKKMCSDVEVCSSGIGMFERKIPSKTTVEVCRSHGIDITNHTATYFRDSDIAEMDLVLTFEMYHKNKIEIYYPDLKVCTIRQFIGEYPYDINDPAGGDFNAYDACFNEICRVLKKVRSKICP